MLNLNIQWIWENFYFGRYLVEWNVLKEKERRRLQKLLRLHCWTGAPRRQDLFGHFIQTRISSMILKKPIRIRSWNNYKIPKISKISDGASWLSLFQAKKKREIN